MDVQRQDNPRIEELRGFMSESPSTTMDDIEAAGFTSDEFALMSQMDRSDPEFEDNRTTVFGKPVWEDMRTGEMYSEKSETRPIGTEYMSAPTIDPDTGEPYESDFLANWFSENGNVDPFTGDKIPTFSSVEDADKYAKWRSENQFNSDVLDENYWSAASGLEDTSGGSELSYYNPTWREKSKYAISGFMQDNLGMDNYQANKFAEGFTGNENASWDNGGIGLLDFTPAGLGYGTQEAKRDFRIASNNDDKLGMGLAVGEGLLNVAEAFPLSKAAIKPLRAGAESLVDLAKRVDVDSSTLGSLGGNISLKPKVDSTEAQAVLDIRAAQMELAVKDRIQPSGENPLFDLSPDSYTKTLPEQKKTPVPRQPTGTNQPLPKGDRGRAVNESVNSIADRLAERMKPWLGTEAQYFYHTGPIVDKAMSMGFKKEEVYEWMKEFADAYAATSPRTETAQNIRNATLVMTKRHLGIDLDDIIGPGGTGINERGYPMMIGRKGDLTPDKNGNLKPLKADGIHRKLRDDVDAGGMNPNTNPKPATFSENVYGNLDGVTVDTHAIRGALDAMNEINPGSIPIDYIKPKFRDQYKADPLSLNPANMIDDSMGSQMVDGTKMQTEYAVFSDIYRLTAEKLGVSPAEAQSMGWFGSGDSTGLASELKSVARLLDERIDVTAQALGESKENVFKKLLNKEIPVLSLFGAATGAGLMSDGEDNQPQLARGGFLDKSEGEKGIMSLAGQDMADEAFRLDRAKADLNGDGKLNEYEKARGKAVQKAMKNEEPKELFLGGLLGALGGEGAGGLLASASPLGALLSGEDGASKLGGLGLGSLLAGKLSDSDLDPKDMLGGVLGMALGGGPVPGLAGMAMGDKYNDKIEDVLKKYLTKDFSDNDMMPLMGLLKDRFAQGGYLDGSDNKTMTAAHGGMSCGEGMMSDPYGEGMMPGSYYTTEEETGNPVPVGSLPEEVSDDISALLSEGEYVIPADVVRWHGLKHIQDMMTEAKTGLMSMDMMGQLHDTGDSGEEYGEEDGQGEPEEYETPEGNDVEVASVDTEEEVLEEDDEEEKATTVSYAFKSTPKVAFIR